MVVLSLGSNIGNRQENLRKAIDGLNSAGLEILKISSIYETEPIGFKEQDKFYNIVLTAEYSKDSLELLSEIHRIEKNLGRKREFENSPRTIDIDIITFNDQKVDTESLTIPHKEYMNRKFVLIPLAEIEPKFIFNSKRSIEETLSKCNDSSEVVKLTELNDEI
ncbi:MAG: 2-amino-4-hydroxy-6-hydroxymethyldihydropteridine diphosphokinase [Candidatus Delongbacteria bacterium]|nr:2-amino-4-hydroxy-6-hydroxymethyldihydropteridine diphosphokinase [Candidatus Delongbacteria bacterium]